MKRIFMILGCMLISQCSTYELAHTCIEGNCINGQGTAGDGIGTQYIGEFKDGLYHGQGAWTGYNGSSYVGGWKEGRHHGNGINTTEEGDTIECEWSDNHPYYPTSFCVGEAIFEYTNGERKIVDFSAAWTPPYTLAGDVDMQSPKSNQSYTSQGNSRSSNKKSLGDTIIEGAVDIMIYKLLGVKPTWNMKLVRADQFTCTYEDKDGDEITLPRKVKSSSAKLKTDPFFGGESIKTSTTFEKCD